jgi:hypothetical protein
MILEEYKKLLSQFFVGVEGFAFCLLVFRLVAPGWPRGSSRHIALEATLRPSHPHAGKQFCLLHP